MCKEATVERLSKTMKLSEESVYRSRAPQNTKQDWQTLEQDARFDSAYLQHKGEEVSGEVGGQYVQGDP
jgi:hypothetical protein